jgi:cytochrome c oxidase accessory protein FixG
MDTSNQPIQDTEEYRNSIATIDDRGKRSWIFPKKPKGRYYNWRTYFSWVLLAFFFITPFIEVNGNPFLLINVFERKFVLFGILFPPQDFHLLVLSMLTGIVFIILFTVVYGRIFCGWICPQTIFLEMVFRKIDYFIEGDHKAQRKLKEGPWTTDKVIKRVIKHSLFILFSILAVNTFAAYLIGIDGVFKIAQEPISMNVVPFMTMVLFTAAYYFVFSWFREQVCIVACPYGRLQGVMLDKNSIVVAYDNIRGEPRGKKTKKKEGAEGEAAPIVGDCIDCTLCVQVCPTGIDIRNGTQLECVNCTACLDACDEVMDKIDRPRGLIRYDSLKGIEEGGQKIFTTRVKAYTAVLAALMILVTALLLSRSDVELLILRSRGTLYNKVDETHINNLFNYEIINKTTKSFPVEMKIKGDVGRIEYVGGNPPDSIPQGVTKGIFFIIVEEARLTERKTKIQVEISSDGKVIETAKTTFLGPHR